MSYDYSPGRWIRRYYRPNSEFGVFIPLPPGAVDYNGQTSAATVWDEDYDNGNSTSSVFAEELEAGDATP